MTENPPGSDAELPQWIIEAARVTAFYPTKPAAENWWEEIAGQPPNATSSLQIPQTSDKVQQASGTAFGGEFSVVRQQNRVDFGFSPSPVFGGLPSTPAIPFISQIPEHLKRWVETTPAVSRLALGAICFRPAKDEASTIKTLQEFIKTPDNIEAQDFLLQINRPKNVTVANNNVRINRLSKWSLAKYVMFRMQAGPGMIPSQEVQQLAPIVNVELDFNTASLPADESLSSVGEVLKLLVALACEVLDKGDQP